MKSRRDTILGRARDLAAALLYYDRKEDEDLGEGQIEQAIRAGEVSVEEIVEAFRAALAEGIIL